VFVFHPSGSFDITGGNSCENKPLQWSISGCTVTVGPQSLSGVSFANSGSGTERTITVGIGSVGLKYTATGAACPKQGTASDGVYTDGMSFGAKDWSGQTQGIAIVG
jgi:hypothetical protein